MYVCTVTPLYSMDGCMETKYLVCSGGSARLDSSDDNGGGKV